jgi:uncharacterized protein YodC (DUF2158 family)
MSEESRFKPGDVVTLESGGPEMTVLSEEAGRVFCHWFEGTPGRSGHFPADALSRRIIRDPARGLEVTVFDHGGGLLFFRHSPHDGSALNQMPPAGQLPRLLEALELATETVRSVLRSRVP